MRVAHCSGRNRFARIRGLLASAFRQYWLGTLFKFQPEAKHIHRPASEDGGNPHRPHSDSAAPGALTLKPPLVSAIRRWASPRGTNPHETTTLVTHPTPSPQYQANTTRHRTKPVAGHHSESIFRINRTTPAAGSGQAGVVRVPGLCLCLACLAPLGPGSDCSVRTHHGTASGSPVAGGPMPPGDPFS